MFTINYTRIAPANCPWNALLIFAVFLYRDFFIGAGMPRNAAEKEVYRNVCG